MNKFHLPPLWRLPDFDKREYWELIQDLGTSLEVLSADLSERNQQLEDALTQIAELKRQLLRPEKTSENASLAPSQDRKRAIQSRETAPQSSSKKRVGHQRTLPEAEVICECEAQACEQCGMDLVGCGKMGTTEQKVYISKV